MPMLFALALGLLALAYILAPLFRAHSASIAAANSLDDAVARAEEAKQALRDIDFDYRLGNLGESDYTDLRSTYEQRALGALKTRYEREQALDALLDRELAQVRARVAAEAAAEKATSAAPMAPPPSSAPAAEGERTSATEALPGAHATPTSTNRPASRGPRARRQKGG